MGTEGVVRSTEIVVRRFGGPEALETVTRDIGPLPPGHAHVRMLAAGVGLTDVMARTGDYLLQRTAGFSPGYELVGEVVDYAATGDDPAWVAPGTRVAVSLPAMGAYREHLQLPAWQLVPVPDGLDTIVAACIPLDYLTAWSVLHRHGRVAEGDTVLIQGASGGVGQALSQLGKRAGLRMYGTASSGERLARYGVEFIDYRTQDFRAVLREREPDGIQAVFDHLGGATLRGGYRLLARGGVAVSYAFAGRPGHMRMDTVRGAVGSKVRGLWPGRRTALCMLPAELRSDHDWYRATLRTLLEMARDGAIVPEVGRVFPLAKAADAHRALERRDAGGKIVLTTE